MASTTGRNRSILAGLVSPGEVTDTPTVEWSPAASIPSPERLTTRLTGLARVTSGDIKEKTLKLVDPARCRMWSRHNRRYELLTDVVCADLLESLRAQGQQEFPAIVRRVRDDPTFDYEVICGARRHWSVAYLRTVEHRDFRFLIEERDLDDEAAFRLSDVENRAREDICDYERALDYRDAMESYYGGVAQRMAERLEVSKGWLSRFLDLAKLPDAVVDAFGDVRLIRENHARELKPLLAEPSIRPKVMAEAIRLGEQQLVAKERGGEGLDAPAVIAALKRSAISKRSSQKTKTAPVVVQNDTGATLFTITRKGRKRAVFEICLDAGASNEEFQIAFSRALENLRNP